MAFLVDHITIELCGLLVGFLLALTGSGGSTIAIPLLLYVVGVDNMHLAIGTSALAVSVNAFANLIPHAKAGQVRWKPGIKFAIAGMLGALLASEAGKRVPADMLTLLFASLIIVVAFFMLHKALHSQQASSSRLPALPTQHPNLRLMSSGLGAGSIAGFFGVGGGFIIVPGLIFAARMTTSEAIATSLFGVGCFGLTTALSYASAGMVDWPLAIEFVGAGIVGGWLGVAAMRRLTQTAGALEVLFAAVLVLVAVYMTLKTIL